MSKLAWKNLGKVSGYKVDYPKLLIDLKMLKSNKKIIDFLLYEWFHNN